MSSAASDEQFWTGEGDAERFREAGMPEHVIAYVTEAEVQPAETMGVMFGPLLPVSVGIGLAAWLSPKLERTVWWAGYLRAHEENALLFDAGHTAAMLICFVAWTIASLALCSWLNTLGSRQNVVTFITTARSSDARSLRRLMRGASPELDAAQFVRRVNLRWVKPLTVAAVLASALGAYAVTLEVQTNSVFTSEAYIRAPFLPWASTASRSWEDVTRVEVACTYGGFSRRSRYDAAFIYEVFFADGASVRLDGADSVRGRSMDALVAIDARLRPTTRIQYRRWMGRDPKNRRCLARYEEWLTPDDYQKLRGLLRITYLGD